MSETPWYELGPPVGAWPEAPEPDGAVAMGPADLEPVGIFLGSLAMETLERAFASSPDRAAAGFLVGRAFRGPARPFIVVTGVIISTDRRDAVEGPRFSAKALAEMERIWREKHPGEWAVGWFHGRPKRGVALSDFDRFTHHRLFPGGWHIALFVDTERDASLLYRPEGAALVPCDSFYYFRQNPEPHTQKPAGSPFPFSEAARAGSSRASSRESHASSDDARQGSEAPTGQGRPSPAPSGAPSALSQAPRWTAGLALLLVAAYLLLPNAPGSLPWLQNRASERSHNLAELSHTLDLLRGEQERLQLESRNAVQLSVQSSQLDGAGSTSPAPGTFTAERAGTSARPAGTPTDGAIGVIEYTIRPGDTLWEISAAFTGNPLSFKELARKNGIANPDLIFPGQRLLLPRALAVAPDGETP